MDRIEILHLQRQKVFLNLAEKKDNRAILLTELMDIDDELEEWKKGKMEENENKVN